jgi:hypothetical protein
MFRLFYGLFDKVMAVLQTWSSIEGQNEPKKTYKICHVEFNGTDKPEEKPIARVLKSKIQCWWIFEVSGLNYSIVRPGSLTNEPLSIELEGKLNKWGENKWRSPNLDANIRW